MESKAEQFNVAHGSHRKGRASISGSSSTHGSQTTTDYHGVEIDQKVLNLFLDEETGLEVSLPKFFKYLQRFGLHPLTDPRFNKVISLLKTHKLEQAGSEQIIDFNQLPETLDIEEFYSCIKPNLSFFNKIFSGNLIISDWISFAKECEKIYDEVEENSSGNVHDKIPNMLLKNQEDAFTLSICTVDGQLLSFGQDDRNVPLCDIVLPLLYGIAVTEFDSKYVHSFVGKETQPKDASMSFLGQGGKPYNPLTDAGGIVLTALLCGEKPISQSFETLYTKLRSFTGSDSGVGFSNSFCLSMINHNNELYGMGHHLREQQALPKDSQLDATVEMFMHLNAINVGTEPGSVIAATLASGGVCPLNFKKVISSNAVRDTLSLMLSCGMNDYSGAYAFEVGLPSKSNRAGLMMVVVPYVMGICIFSPALDNSNNSVRGVEFCKKFTERFRFHLFEGRLKKYENKLNPTRSGLGETKEQQMMSLLFAAVRGNMSQLYRYHAENVDFNWSDYDGRTALHLAVCGEQMDVVIFLVKKCKVNVNALDRWETSPLDDSRKLQNLAIYKFLKKSGALSFSEMDNDPDL